MAALAAYEAAAGGAVVSAPCDLVISLYDVLQPDVMYFSADRVGRIDPHGGAHVPPSLVVEVLSAGTRVNDRGRKMRTLARFGVHEYWLVDVDHDTIEQYVLERGGFELRAVAAGDEAIASTALAGFRIPPAHVCRVP